MAMSINKLTILLGTIVLVASGTGCAGFLLHAWLHDAFPLWLALTTAAAASFIALLIVVSICHNHLCAIRSITRQIDRLDRDRQIGMIMIDENEELMRLSSALNRYLTGIRFQTQQEQDWLRELNIRVDVAEAEKRQAEAIFYSISEAVIVVDPNNELLLANPAAEDIFDFSQEFNYREPIDLAVNDRELLALIYRVQSERSSNRTEQLVRTHPITGREIILKVMASCVLNDNERPVGVVVIIHDITAEREMSRMKDDIINSVSHELKTPLASIRAYAEMLADNEAGSPQTARSFCDIIQDQSLRLNRMIDNILNLSKIEAGRWRENKQPLNIAALFDDVIFMMNPQLQDKQIALDTSMDEPEMILFADRDMMFQVFANLIGNAVKYSPERSRISLRARHEEEWTVMEIEDQGYGITPEDHERIFEKFYRVPAHAQLASGTGLGLNLVRQVVETVHHGAITLHSKPGQGSCFTVRLPRMNDPELLPDSLCEEYCRQTLH